MNPSAEPSHIAPARAHRYGWVALLIAGPLLLLILKLFPSLDQPVLHSPFVHVLIAGGASALGICLALFVLHVAIRAQDGRVYLVGMGFLSTASIFLIHAISTPDVLMSGRGLATAWSAPLSLTLGAFFFALSGLELPAALNRWLLRYARTGLLAYLICWLIYSTTFLLLIPAAAVAALPDSAHHTISAAQGATDEYTIPGTIYRGQGDAGYAGAPQPADRSANAQPAPDLSEYLRILLVRLCPFCRQNVKGRVRLVHTRLHRRGEPCATCQWPL